MQDFISEEDLQTFEGWLKYQQVDATEDAADLEKWRRAFQEARERVAACPKVGLMKLQPVPGELLYAVAVEDGSNLWLTLWVKHSWKGEFFVFRPRGDREWDSHTSYHRNGTLHIKSYDEPVLKRKNQPLTGPFRGSVDLGRYDGHGPKGVGAICDSTAFTGVLKIPPGVLGPRDGAVKVDLVEPCHDPMDCPELRIITRMDFCDASPYVVIRVGTSAIPS